MSEPDGASPKQPVPSAPPPADLEAPPSGLGVSAISRRWRKEDLVRKGSLAMRGLALLFSVLSFLIMVTNRHGGWKDFDKYEEFRYLLAISILAILYTGFQAFRDFYQVYAGKYLFHQNISALIDFSGDQVAAYLLISAASTAVPMTNRMRDNVDNSFTDSLAASITMAFLAFFSLALSALIAGYKLATQSYI